MPLAPLPPTDTRGLFRPLTAEIGATLGGLSDAAWEKPTAAGSWLVRDVAAHLTDTALRRLSLHRDGHALAPAGGSPAGEREIVSLVNGLNAAWVGVARRFSGRVLTSLYRTAAGELADFFESLPLEGTAPWGVSWAGESESPLWFDVAREFTEQWHHGAQIREAAGLPPFPDPSWLRAVLETSVRALPRAYAGVKSAPGSAVALEIDGPSGGLWTLRRETGGWSLWRGEDGTATARASLSDEAAWRLFFHALSPEAATAALRVRGDRELVQPLVRARSVVV